jgi:hypothetical protein
MERTTLSPLGIGSFDTTSPVVVVIGLDNGNTSSLADCLKLWYTAGWNLIDSYKVTTDRVFDARQGNQKSVVDQRI